MGNNTDSIAALTAEVQQFCEARDWDQFHTPKDLAIGISTEAGELLDIFRFKSDEECRELLTGKAREHVEEELADVLFFVLRFAQMYGISPGEALKTKIRRNAQRYPVEISRGSNLKHTEHDIALDRDR